MFERSYPALWHCEFRSLKAAPSSLSEPMQPPLPHYYDLSSVTTSKPSVDRSPSSMGRIAGFGDQRVNFQSRESSFESHFPFLRVKFNFLYQKAIWEMGNEMWAFWILISNFLSLTSHFLYLAYCLITQLSFNFLFPQWNFISSSSLWSVSHPSLFNQL